MKKTVLKSRVLLFFTTFLLLSIVLPLAPSNSTVYAVDRDVMEQQEYDNLKAQLEFEDELIRWLDDQQSTNRLTKDEVESINDALISYNQILPDAINIIKDIEDGGDFDTAGLINSVLNFGSGIAAACPPYGSLVSGCVGIFQTMFTAIMGGEDAPEASVLMEDRLNQQFDNLSNQIAGLENEIGKLSDEINESTNRIISSMSTLLENSDSKSYLRDFMLCSGSGDFGYNQFRNYIYGSATDNSSASTAYYSKLLQTQFENGSNEEIQYYYNKLYSAIADNRDVYYNFIVGDGVSKSLVQCYYDIVSSRPDLAAELGMSAKMAAIQFAYDLYQTQLMMDEIMLICNNYQYVYMLANEMDSYNYGTGIIFKADILGEDNRSAIFEQIALREDEIISQIAEDLAYIFETNAYYTIEDSKGNLYTLYTEQQDGITYGKIISGQIVYLNRVPQSVCEQFDMDASDFSYSADGFSFEDSENNSDGMFVANANSINSTIEFQYKGTAINHITFSDGSLSDFSGGSGTASDPYLISTPAQFKKIGENPDLYYRLIDDIDFNDVTIRPIGCIDNSLGNKEYQEFNGILDGNGYMVSNLTIEDEAYAGLFGKIGLYGVIKNLTVSNISINMSITNAKEDISNFHGGMIAAENKGTITNCRVLGCDLNIVSNTTNDHANRSVYFYAGGITGKNNGTLSYIIVENSQINVSSNHDFGGADVNRNRNEVYVGGICGYNCGQIRYTVVEADVSVAANAVSIYNPKNTVNPYVTTLAGGITAKQSYESGTIAYVNSSASTTVEAKLTCQSNWGTHYANRVQDGHTYIPSLDPSVFQQIQETKETILASFPAIEESIVECNDMDVYKIGESKLHTLDLTINGQKIGNDNITVLEVYGFDTYNNSTTAEKKISVTVLFAVNTGDNLHQYVTSFPITIEKDYCVSIEIINFTTEYSKGDTIQNIAAVHQYYASGESNHVTGATLEIKNKENEPITIASEYGTQDITITYDGVSCAYEIHVKCSHESNRDYSNTELYELKETVEPTCQHIGYEVYKCKECGKEDIGAYYVPKTDHDYRQEISEEATCQNEGIIGRIYCSYCGLTVAEAVKIPQKPHEIVKVDDSNADNSRLPTDDAHYCMIGDHWIAHEYTVSESIVDSVLTYTYTCHGCGYVSNIQDTNIITTEAGNQPTVIVSDGYALEGGDHVTVYVQLANNPGVYGANFGIRYDERLTLVDWSEGMLFSYSLAKDSAQVSCGYNFVWANGDKSSGDGNLLELVFMIPEDAIKDDSYHISVVYNVVTGGLGQDIIGGFSVDGSAGSLQEMKQFIAKPGVIRVVDHLPGDVNSDGCVDIIDALYLSSCLVGKTPVTDEIRKYGDVDLVGGVTLNDVVTILQSLTGGYGANLLYPEYDIYLNSNGFDCELDSVVAQLYGENCTYGSILSGIEMKRTGYKFLGWFTRLVGEDDTPVGYDEFIKYDPDQKIQTLYARWEKNSVSFDLNGATTPERIDTHTYGEGDNSVTLVEPEEVYTIRFIEPFSRVGVDKALTHLFLYWEDQYGNEYRVGEVLDLSQADLGALKFKAVWSDEWTLEGQEDLHKDGYTNETAEDTKWYKEYNYGFSGNVSKQDFETLKKCTAIYVEFITPIKYSISYDLKGGSFETDQLPPQKVAYDATFTVDNPTRPGYTFNGWKITGMDGKEYTVNETSFQNLCLEEDGTVTFTAQWIPNKYTVVYNGGNKPEEAQSGIQGDMDEMVFYADAESLRLSSNGFTLTGWCFEGWTTFDKTEVVFSDGESISMEDVLEYADDNNEIHLYAVWSPALEYTLNSDGETYTVTGVGSYVDSTLEIPATYMGKPVTSVGGGAFADCSILTSVIIPDGVVSIGNGAFADNNYISGYSNLTSIVIPDSVTSIGSAVFAGCNKLVYNEYDNAYYLGNAKNPYVALIKGKNTSITSCEIYDKTIVIAGTAFFACRGLTSIEIPGSVTSIGDMAFYGCSGLTSIEIPSSVTSIGVDVFYGCSGLKSIEIPSSVTSIGEGVFFDCSGLTSIEIPSSVTSIGDRAFYGCSGLTSIEIPSSVTSIGDRAFYGCSGLKSIEIPGSVTSIENYAFSGCSNLTSITFAGTIAQWNAMTKGPRWDDNTGTYTVYCKDGTISK